MVERLNISRITAEKQRWLVNTMAQFVASYMNSLEKPIDLFLQMFLFPMFRYLSSTTPNWSRLPKPIYRSSKGRVFNEWVSTWTSYMITKVK